MRSSPSATGSQQLFMAFASAEPEFPVRVFFLATDGEESVSDEHGIIAADMGEVERAARDVALAAMATTGGTIRRGGIRSGPREAVDAADQRHGRFTPWPIRLGHRHLPQEGCAP